MVSNSNISNNLAGGEGGGIRIYGTSTISDSSILGNSTTGSGGGVSSHGSVTITSSNVSNNSAGIATSSNSTHIPHNAAASHISGIDQGGGIWALGEISIYDSTVSGNTASGDGGGIYVRQSRETSINNSTISGNSSEKNGGGIAVIKRYAAPAIISNSTISGNEADNHGGGISFDMWDLDEPNIATISHSTVVSNRADRDRQNGGIGSGIFINQETLLLDHSIVASNSPSSAIGPDLTGYLGVTLDVHYSLIGNNKDTGLTEAPVGSPDANGNLIGGPGRSIINPRLGPLANNGGPTLTHALLTVSPAIDAGDPLLRQGDPGLVEFDQRGAPYGRVVGGRIDIGAYEHHPPASTLDADFDQDNDVDGADMLAWQRGFGKLRRATLADGDATGNGKVDDNDTAVLEATFGTLPVLHKAAPFDTNNTTTLLTQDPPTDHSQAVDEAFASIAADRVAMKLQSAL